MYEVRNGKSKRMRKELNALSVKWTVVRTGSRVRNNTLLTRIPDPCNRCKIAGDHLPKLK